MYMGSLIYYMQGSLKLPLWTAS